jgi:hypothetical protein
MGLRFRRSVRLFPGVRLNFSGSGISTSIGGRGAHVTIGHGHIRQTVGIPGTGISYTTISKDHGQTPQQRSGADGSGADGSSGIVRLAVILVCAGVLITVLSGPKHPSGPAPHDVPTATPAPPYPTRTALPPSEPHESYSVAVDSLNQRDRPNGAVIGALHRGELVDVFETSQGWARISKAGYPPRWVFERMLCKGSGCASDAHH